MLFPLRVEAPDERAVGRVEGGASLGDVEPDHAPEALVQLDLIADVVAVLGGPKVGAAERDIAQAGVVEPDRVGAFHVSRSARCHTPARKDRLALLERPGNEGCHRLARRPHDHALR
jgi:hypothetical protein